MMFIAQAGWMKITRRIILSRDASTRVFFYTFDEPAREIILYLSGPSHSTS